MLRSHRVYVLGLLIVTLGLTACSGTGHKTAEIRLDGRELARLGAGDDLGQAIFSHYVAMVRAGGTDPLVLRQSKAAPVAATDPWVMAVRLPAAVVGVSGEGKTAEAVVLPAASQEPASQAPQAG